MSVAPVRVVLVLVLKWEGPIVYEDGAEEKVLHYGKFTKDLSDVHLLHACVDFVPCFDS